MSQFPKAWAIGVINKMQDYYQGRFDNTFPKRQGVSDKEYIDKLAMIACEVFEGLNPDDIKRGLAKMKTSKFCPVFPEFRDWCLGDQRAQWLGANEAWNIARGSIDFNGYELTVVWTKECAIAFDAVADQVKLGDKYQIAEAKKVFVERYERMVAESLERGEKPSYQVSYGDDKEQRKTALKEAENAGFLPSSETQLMIEQTQSPNDADSEVMKFKTTAQEHLAKLKGLLKVNVPKPEKVSEEDDLKLFNLPDRLNGWLDPFDDQAGYVDKLKKEGKPIPIAIMSGIKNE